MRAAPLASDSPLPEPTSAFVGSDPGRVRTRYAWVAAERAVVGTASFGPNSEGLPGFVHGGALAAVADEAMGWATWCSGAIAPGATLTHRYVRPVRTGQAVEVRAWVADDQGRKLTCRAELRCGGQVVLASEGLYVAIEPPDFTPFAAWPGASRFAPERG